MEKPTRKTMADLKKVQGIAAVEPTATEEQPETETTETTTPEETTATETTEPTQTAAATEASSAVTTPTASTDSVSITATELAQLRADAKELHLMKPQYAVLEKWYKNMSEAGAVIDKDASDLSPKKVSRATQKAIDIKNSRK